MNLLERLGQHNGAWPSQDQIASDVGFGERAVRDALHELTTAHFVVVQRRGQGQTNIYWLDIEKLLEWAELQLSADLERQNLPPRTENFADLERNEVPQEGGQGEGGQKKIATTTSARAKEKPNIFTIYENTIGGLDAHLAQRLGEVEAEYTAECIGHSFREASENNARSWRYVETILKRHKKEGCFNGRTSTLRTSGSGRGTKRAANAAPIGGPDLDKWRAYAENGTTGNTDPAR